MKEGYSYIYTFPFFLYCGIKESKNITIKLSSGEVLRIYPPFRQSDANFIPMPHSNFHKIPFIKADHIDFDKLKYHKVAVLPQVGLDSNNAASIIQVIGSTFDKEPSPFPNDSIRIDILNKSEFNPPDSFVQHILSHLRWRSNQWWIGRSISETLGYLRNSFKINAFGSPIENIAGNGTCKTLSKLEKSIDDNIWQEAIASSRKSISPDFNDLLYLDAVYFYYSNEIRHSIINLTMSSEQTLYKMAELKFRKANGNSRFKIKKYFPGDDLRDHIDQYAFEYFGRSFKNDYPEHYNIISKLWISRNNVAHGREACYYFEGRKHILDNKDNKEMLEAVSILRSWFFSLQ